MERCRARLSAGRGKNAHRSGAGASSPSICAAGPHNRRRISSRQLSDRFPDWNRI